MRKLTGFLLSMLCLFIGITIGFLAAPIKKGITIGNNCDSFNSNGNGNAVDLSDPENNQDDGSMNQ